MVAYGLLVAESIDQIEASSHVQHVNDLVKLASPTDEDITRSLLMSANGEEVQDKRLSFA